VIKDVVVNLSSRSEQDFTPDYAISLAGAFGAHVVGIAFVYDAIIPDGAFGGVPVELIEMQREENSKLAAAAVQRFEASAKATGISAQSNTLDATLGGGATLFAELARRFDIAVVGQAQRERGASEELMIEAVLFETGRPVLVVPYIQKQGLKLDRVIACWDGGRTAARAIADAMPLLQRAKAVELVIVAEEHKRVEVHGASMLQHLSRHGISATAKRMSKADLSIDNVILSYAADSGADIMVMGGYGHSRLREFILGGVTRGILGSMTIPVLMSH
jgi:nucleotide-binding universal stress UspA family protein